MRHAAVFSAVSPLGTLFELPLRRRLPRHPVPVARLARLAVTLGEQGQGLGESLLQDVVKRCLELRTELGIHALLVDALHERAAAFYRHYGFRETAAAALTLYLPLGNAGQSKP